MTIRELIDQLTDIVEELGSDRAEVRLAHQPSWPFEYSIGEVAVVRENEDEDELEDELEAVVYIGEHSQIGYLPGVATRALGWTRR